MRLRTGAAGAAIHVFAIRIGAAGFAYVGQVLMARLMGGTEYGIFAAIWVWIAILGHSATLGLSQGACRFMPADQARGDLAAVRAYLVGGGIVTLASAIVIALGGLALIWVEGSLLEGPFAAPLLVAALVLPLFALQDYCEGVARGQNWAVLAIAPPYLLRQGLIMIAMLAAVGFGAPAEARIAVLCTLVATGVAVAVQATLLLRSLRAVLPAGPRRYAWRRWFRACLPIAASDLASAASSFIDVVVLSLLVSPATVGLYFAATRIQQFVVFVHFAATAATAQRFAAAHAAGDRVRLADLVTLQARLTLVATALIGIAVMAAAPLLLGLFGPEFRDSLPILAVLVAGSIAASAFGPGEDLLNMLGGERLAAGIALGMLVLAGGLCFALVPALGVIGAALAMAMATVVRAVAMAWAAHAVHGLVTPVRIHLFGKPGR
ncbi:polysaccharide biosynthesis protein [Methylobacterium sp. Leaf104]|uniref:lipopolysaccharide biosynthesis protein n=1 Tax=Methylobacterium TaxID=407 RepID=UPI0006FEB17B|nr:MULTISPECIES: oligosaccharide flippase family protein [Methylobacterium]KQP30616.1 polysaccharide biosynthesis protein [Methylobacterium sp. Leaf104]MCI9881994.1 oligosaccharide flippase family protein [Methylobacterium goesingense]